jgi:hypothetical protein
MGKRASVTNVRELLLNIMAFLRSAASFPGCEE